MYVQSVRVGYYRRAHGDLSSTGRMLLSLFSCLHLVFDAFFVASDYSLKQPWHVARQSVLGVLVCVSGEVQ